jgi:hypothetical protein
MRMTASWSGRYGPTEYKVVARLIRAPERGLPSDRHPDRIERAAVLGAVKVGLASAERVERLVRRPTLTAPARAGFAILRVGTKKRDSRSNKETDQESKKERIAALKPLDNKSPIQGLLGVHSRYGLHTRAVTVYRDTLTRGFSHLPP